MQSTVKVVPCTRLPSRCQGPIPRCQASKVQVWPSVLVRGYLNRFQYEYCVIRVFHCHWCFLKYLIWPPMTPPFIVLTAERIGMIQLSVRWATLQWWVKTRNNTFFPPHLAKNGLIFSITSFYSPPNDFVVAEKMDQEMWWWQWNFKLDCSKHQGN